MAANGAEATAAFPNGSNVLQRIGTVFYVYGSQNGGGWLIGGGYDWNLATPNFFNGGFLWHRGASLRERANTDEHFHFADPVFRIPAYHPNVYGTVWHDGWKTKPEKVGFSGGWEVLSCEPHVRDECRVVRAGLAFWRPSTCRREF